MERALILAHENGVKILVQWSSSFASQWSTVFAIQWSPILQANGVSDFVVSAHIAFANVKLFFLIRDEAKHEFKLSLPIGVGFQALYEVKILPIKGGFRN